MVCLPTVSDVHVIGGRPPVSVSSGPTGVCEVSPGVQVVQELIGGRCTGSLWLSSHIAIDVGIGF